MEIYKIMEKLKEISTNLNCSILTTYEQLYYPPTYKETAKKAAEEEKASIQAQIDEKKKAGTGSLSLVVSPASLVYQWAEEIQKFSANIVAVPEGKIGIIKNAYSNNELRPEPGVSYSNYGRIRISEWGVGETQGMNGAEYTKAESLSLPVITAIEGIFTLKTDTKTE